MHAAILLNVNAAGVAAQESILQDEAHRNGCLLLRSHSKEDVKGLIEEALSHGCRRLIVAGGDGSMNRVINSLPKDSPIELGLVPMGTGNDCARCLGMSHVDLTQALELACTNPAVPMDLVRMQAESTRLFANAACGGFGGEIASDIRSSDKQKWGAFAYWMTAFSKLIGLHPFEVQITNQDRTWQQSVYGITIANGRYVGGGFPIAHEAELDDGQFDVIVIPVLPSWELVSAGLNLMIDLWYRPEQVQSFRAKKVEIHSQPPMLFSVDGEAKQAVAAATFELVPQALRVVIGDAPEGFGTPERSAG